MNFLQILGHLAHGVGYTLLVTIACCATALLAALAITVLRRLTVPGMAQACSFFVFVFQGVPVLVMLFLVYFGLPGIGIKVAPLTAMMLSLGLIAGAYLAEVFRGALESVDESEVLAAQAMGMSRWQISRYIEFPQMLRFSMPAMVNEFTTVLKYSPFAYTVGIPEITKQAMTLSATTLRGIEIYLAVGILYFLIYRILLAAVHLVERRFQVPGMAAA